MSEYLKIEALLTDDPEVMVFQTNLPLTEGPAEFYHSLEEMEEGSAVAQALATIEGIKDVNIEENNLTVNKEVSIPWHIVVADITAALKEFFL